MKMHLTLISIFLSLTCVATEGFASAPLLKVEEGHKNGVQVLYVLPSTTFDRSTMLLDLRVDGHRAELEQPGENIWLYRVTGTQGQIRSASFKVSLANSDKLDQLKASQAALAEEISALELQLSQATDPGEIAALTAALGEKNKLQIRLQADFENLKNFIGTHNHFFQVNF